MSTNIPELGPGYIIIGIVILVAMGAVVALDEFKKKL